VTRRERVLAAMDHRETDRVPHQINLTAAARETLERHYGADRLEAVLGNHFAFTGVEPPDAWREVRPGHWRDAFGVEWDRTVDRDIGTVCNCVLPEPTLAGFRLPDPHDPHRFAHLEAFIAQHPDQARFCSIGFSFFERAWTLRGMENLFLDMIERPDFVEELLDAILEHNLALLEHVLPHDLDGVRFGDDWGQQRGLLMGAPHWRRFLKPRLARLYGAVKAAGKRVMIHSCGDVREIFPDLIEIGVDVFNPFQPEVMDVAWMKRTYGDRITFYGGLSLQHTLPYGSPDEVKAEVRWLQETIGKGGGFVLSPSHDVTRDVPLENLVAMIEAIHGG